MMLVKGWVKIASNFDQSRNCNSFKTSVARKWTSLHANDTKQDPINELMPSMGSGKVIYG